MTRNSTPPVGALHPIVFFVVVYGISLFMAIFVCRSVYFSINKDSAHESKAVPGVDMSYTGVAANATALK